MSILVSIIILPQALSPHPKASHWPQNAINLLNITLESNNEQTFYREAHQELDRRIAAMGSEEVAQNAQLLKALRSRVTKVGCVCMLCEVQVV